MSNTTYITVAIPEGADLLSDEVLNALRDGMAPFDVRVAECSGSTYRVLGVTVARSTTMDPVAGDPPGLAGLALTKKAVEIIGLKLRDPQGPYPRHAEH